MPSPPVYYTPMAAHISKQQKGGLATAKAADVSALRLCPSMRWAFYMGAGSYSEAADILNVVGIKTPRGGRWFPASVQRTIQRIERLRGKPLIHPDKLAYRAAYVEVNAKTVRHSEDDCYGERPPRRLRSYRQLEVDRRARRKVRRKVRKEEKIGLPW